MTILTDWPIRLDTNLVLGTYAHGLEVVGGLHGAPGRRAPSIEALYHPGEVPRWDDMPEPMRRSYRIWIGSTDADGAVTHAEGERGHIEENIKALYAVVNKIGAPIAFEQDVPIVGGGVETLTGDCKVIDRTPIDGTRALRRCDLDLHFPYPYLHIGDQVTDPGNSGTFTIDTSASYAPIFDAVVTFKSGTDQRLTVNDGPWAGQYIQYIGTADGTGVRIDCGRHTVTDLPSTRVDGGLRRSRANWLMLPPGHAALELELTGGGTVDLAYYLARS